MNLALKTSGRDGGPEADTFGDGGEPIRDGWADKKLGPGGFLGTGRNTGSCGHQRTGVLVGRACGRAGDRDKGGSAAFGTHLLKAATAAGAGVAGVEVRGLESPARQTGEGGVWAHLASQEALLHQPQTWMSLHGIPFAIA